MRNKKWYVQLLKDAHLLKSINSRRKVDHMIKHLGKALSCAYVPVVPILILITQLEHPFNRFQYMLKFKCSNFVNSNLKCPCPKLIRIKPCTLLAENFRKAFKMPYLRVTLWWVTPRADPEYPAGPTLQINWSWVKSRVRFNPNPWT